MEKIIIILVLILVLVAVSYLIIINIKPINAVCEENEPSNYDFNQIPLKGIDLLQRIRLVVHRIKEKFTLDADVVTSKTSLVSTRNYNRGTLKTGITNTKKSSKYGGTMCTEFPQYIYIPEISVNNPLFAEKGLVGLYEVDSFDKNSMLWKDKSGSGNHATVVGNVQLVSVSGNGSTKTFSTLGGTVGTGIVFPTSILPSTYTLFTVARYSGTKNGRIFDGLGNNWLSGFWNGQTRVAYHTDPWTTNPWNGYSSNWLISSDTNDNYWGNGVSARTNLSNGKSNTRLTINQGSYKDSEASDWQVAYVAVFNRKLSNTERNFVENVIANKFGLTINCPSEQTRINGICTCTNTDKQINPDDEVCIWKACPTGQTRNVGVNRDNKCYPPCSDINMERDPVGNCVCKAGYELWNGKCKTPCLTDQYRETDGYCYYPCDFQRYMNTSAGPGKYYCDLRCPKTYQYWTGYSCECPYPYMKDYYGNCFDASAYYYNPNSTYNELWF